MKLLKPILLVQTMLAVALPLGTAQANPTGTSYTVGVLATDTNFNPVGPTGTVTFDGIAETITDPTGATINDIVTNESVTAGPSGFELVNFSLQGVDATGTVAPLFAEALDTLSSVTVDFFPISWPGVVPLPILNGFSVTTVTGTNQAGGSFDFLNDIFTLTDVRQVNNFGTNVYDMFIEMDSAQFNNLGLTNLNVTLKVPSAVPVPAAIWLFGSGLAGLLGLSKHRRTR